MKQGVDFGYGIKSTLVQCLVLTTTYFLNVQQGIDVMMPTIIIGALESNSGDNTVPGITTEQISWIGSLVYLSPPIGSLFLSLVQVRLGHRACMALTNLIQLSAVLVVVLFPITVSTLYACSMLMGLSTGFATGLSISYSGEVCEPKLRGSLTSALNVFYFVGFFFVSTTYAITKSWKQSLIITVAVPLANMVTLSLTPDSPMWLLSRGKTDKARKVLMKLRGYVSEEKCATEFQEMVQYVSLSAKSEEAKQKNTSILGSFSHPGLRSPLKLMLIYIFFSNVMSGVPYAPYLMHVFKSFKTQAEPAWAMSAYPGFSIIGNVFTILLVHRLGKRCLVLSTITFCSISYLLIGFIGQFYADAEYAEYASWAKLALFFGSTVSSSLGVMPIGWILMSEVFPMKSKNLGCSICSAVYFFLSFFMTKFYMDLEGFIGFYNTFVLFGGVGLIGLVYFYFRLPETENKTLKEIAEQFKLEPV
ncbi:facilitated trehalose transporter Tret1-2 homolog [Metopolophium dirhodum]|uniref:facilitated trehalose transporter Tret1-2 homolog n=1 Tax=Metopolophium dirhodum TaxID=44670 RepID=UPI00298F4967|nr:facilitated trehalose transporter Tret1-2 homolog [Metopolophium dirhodum]